MKIKGQYQWTDLLNADLLHTYQRRHLGFVYFLVAAALGVLSYLFFTGQTDLGLIYTLPPILLISVIGIIFLLINRYISFPNQAKKNFAQQKGMNLPFEFEFTETGFHSSSELGNSTLPWEYFTKWKENEDIIILYQSDSLIHILPKRLFTDRQELDIVKSLLDKNKVKKVSSGFRQKETG